MRYFDAFSGIGGFALALQRVWPDAECVGFSEVDKYATAIYGKHFESHHNWGDITKIDVERIPDFDLLCGGSPCQDISVANNRRDGLRGSASGLFLHWVKVLKAKRPNAFLFENVDGILHSNRGWDFARLLSEVDACGYDAEWRVLNSADFGVPQRRMRCFVVGHLRGRPWRPVLSQSEEGGVDTQPQGQAQGGGSRIRSDSARPDRIVSGALTVNAESSGRNNLIKVNDAKFGGKVYDVLRISPCLTIGHGEDVPKIQVINEGNYADKKVYDSTGVSPALRASVNHVPKIECGVIAGERWRKLTPTECERLQAFPDGWTKEGLFEKGELVWNGEVTLTKAGQLQPHMISAKEDSTYRVVESARYHCLGNAVTVSVIEAICRRMKEVGFFD